MKTKNFLLTLIAVLFLSLLASCAKTDGPLTAAEFIDLGEKYLLEMDYEQAIVQFLKVIEVEPMNPRGYTGLAEAYVGLGDTEKAAEVLKQGLDIIGSNADIQAILDDLLLETPLASIPIQTPEASEAPQGSEPMETPASDTAVAGSGQGLTDILGLSAPMTIYNIQGITSETIAMFEDGPVSSGDELDAQIQRFGSGSSWLYSNIGTELEEAVGFRVVDGDTDGDYCFLTSLEGNIWAIEFTDAALQRMWGFTYGVTTKEDIIEAFSTDSFQEYGNTIAYDYGDNGTLSFPLDLNLCLTQWCAIYIR